jgi:hypothetical protein
VWQVATGDRVDIDTCWPRHALDGPYDRSATENLLPSTALTRPENNLDYLHSTGELHQSVGWSICSYLLPLGANGNSNFQLEHLAHDRDNGDQQVRDRKLPNQQFGYVEESTSAACSITGSCARDPSERLLG